MKIRYVFFSVAFLHLLNLMKPFLNVYLYNGLGVIATLMTLFWFALALIQFGKHVHKKLLDDGLLDKK